MTTFLRLLEADADEKGQTMADAALRWRSGSEPDGIYEVEPASFGQVPGSPFAYWVSERVRALFRTMPALEGTARAARRGLATHDDFRFLRLAWELPEAPSHLYMKGGAYSTYYANPHVRVIWRQDGSELSAPRTTDRAYDRAIVAGRHLYFRPGLTWSRRSQKGLSIRVMPGGCILGDKGPAITELGDLPTKLLVDLALCNSRVFNGLVQLQMAFGSYEVGVLNRTPMPDGGTTGRLPMLAAAAVDLARQLDSVSQTSHAFTVPALLQSGSATLAKGVDEWTRRVLEVHDDLACLQSDVDDIAFDLYGIVGEDRRQMEEGFGALRSSEDEVDAATDDEDDEAEGADPVALTEALLEWALGIALGRFDIRLATGERTPPANPDPFDPLPVCSPGVLQDQDGLPAREPPSGYPLDLPPHGILVDDPGHPWDVATRIEAVLDLTSGDRGHAWIQEAEGILGRDLRDWLRRYGFERHLKRYSRSRRKAPLFWHLAPKSRECGIWLYSPVATRDTFYRIQKDYVDPKLKAAERRSFELRQHAGESPTGQQRKDLTAQESLVEDLRAFGEQVALVAPLWSPFRDDGVVLNCAVLSRLFDHHRTWQKECASKWRELTDGKYDWAGWAMHLWPERVIAACASDRSIAIAHGLEDALWHEGEDGKWKPRPNADTEVAKLVTERRSPAVEAALDAYERAG